MLDLVAGTWSTSHTRIPTLGRIHCTRDVLVLAHILLLHLRIWIGYKGSRQSMVNRAFRYAVSIRAIGLHHRRTIGYIGIRDDIMIGVVVLRWGIRIWRIVSRHDAGGAKKELRCRWLAAGDKTLTEV